MDVLFLKKFHKDLDKLKNRKDKDAVIDLIEKLKSANQLSSISDIKKLAGFKNAYRIRLGNYRVGIFVEKNHVELARIAHRKDIYKVFP